MEKLEILDILLDIRKIGCCNMIDRNCIIRVLKAAGENEAVDYIENLSSEEFFRLLSKDLSDYIRI